MGESCSGNCGSCASHGTCHEENALLLQRMSGIKRKHLVLSGKGGVGKSTVAAVLALALARKGRKVALLDVDFHGPTLPTLFGVQDARMSGDDQVLYPVECAGIGLVSIGLLLEDNDQAVIWRGPAKMGVLKQLLEQTEWGELDDLVVDFPPGTGDEVLSACQLIPGERGAVIVTTPQEVSLADCRKCLDFCRKVELPVAGIVENMSYFECPSCRERHEIFGHGGGEALARKYQVPLLAQFPLRPGFGRECDLGRIGEVLESQFPEATALAEKVLLSK